MLAPFPSPTRLEVVAFLDRSLGICEDLTEENKRRLHVLALDLSLRSRDLNLAWMWARRIEQAFARDREFLAATLCDLGEGYRAAGDERRAREVLQRVEQDFWGTANCARAALTLAEFEANRGEFQAALMLTSKVLGSAEELPISPEAPRFELQRIQYRAARCAVRCELALGRFAAAQRSYQFELSKRISHCGTEREAEEMRQQSFMNFLQGLQALPGQDMDGQIEKGMAAYFIAHLYEAKRYVLDQGSASLPALTRSLGNTDKKSVLASLGLLRDLGTVASASSEKVAGLFTHSSPEVVRAAVDTLIAIGLDADLASVELLALLDAPITIGDKSLESRIHSGLVHFGTEAYIDLLRAQLQSSDDTLRTHALGRISIMGPEASALIPLVIEFIQDPGGSNPSSGSRALRSMGVLAVDAILDEVSGPGKPLQAFQKSMPTVPLSRDQLARCVALVTGEDAVRSRWAMEALVKSSPSSLPSLIELLRCDAPQIRMTAIRALQGAKKRDPLADILLEIAVSDPATKVRSLAVIRFCADQAFPSEMRVAAASAALADGDTQIRNAGYAAARSLPRDSEALRPALEALVVPGPEGEDARRAMRDCGLLD